MQQQANDFNELENAYDFGFIPIYTASPSYETEPSSDSAFDLLINDQKNLERKRRWLERQIERRSHLHAVLRDKIRHEIFDFSVGFHLLHQPMLSKLADRRRQHLEAEISSLQTELRSEQIRSFHDISKLQLELFDVERELSQLCEVLR